MSDRLSTRGMVALIMLGLVSCDDRPLSGDSVLSPVREGKEDAGAGDQASSVATGPSSTTPPRDAAPMPIGRDASNPDAISTPMPPSDAGAPACWASQLPAEVQARPPKLTVAAACKAASVAVWPALSGGTGADNDARADLVGRWVPCGQQGFSQVPHAGIEFGANGRWRLLTTDANGALVAMTPMAPGVVGRYYALSTGQLDMAGEGVTEGTGIFFVGFAVGMDAVRFDGGSGGPVTSTMAVYARAEPSPLDGRDNLPSITDGKCSMVGSWDVPANPTTPQTPAATLSFDAMGNFVGGPLGSNLCAAHTMYGTYRLTPGLFQLTSNIGMGACHWWFDAGYPAIFDASCTHVMLVQRYDNCTGGRGYLNGQTTLTKR